MTKIVQIQLNNYDNIQLKLSSFLQELLKVSQKTHTILFEKLTVNGLLDEKFIGSLVQQHGDTISQNQHQLFLMVKDMIQYHQIVDYKLNEIESSKINCMRLIMQFITVAMNQVYAVKPSNELL